MLEHGDLVAIAKMLGIKGTNGYSPCRSCKTKGVRDITRQGKTYYIPLRTPDVPHQTRPHADPRNLEMRRHSDFDAVLRRVENATSSTTKKFLQMYHGIREEPALTRVKSINNAKSIAWDWRHLFSENVCPQMFYLWSDRTPLLKTGHFDYVIPKERWIEIGQETAEAVKNIPAAFVRVLGNIANDTSNFTAESWAFWFMYIAPIVLKGRLPKKRYYRHMCALANIMKTTIRYELTHKEIDGLEEEIACWVEQYEKCVFHILNIAAVANTNRIHRYYYQYEEGRLAACSLTIHGLLHIASDIRYCGPVWTTWVFYMERFGGALQSAVRSRVHPWSNLTNRNLHLAYIAQLSVKYDLDEELLVGCGNSGGLKRNERIYTDCECQHLPSA
jgi:hypothetical protein